MCEEERGDEKNRSNRFIVVLSGPTAVGKTSFSYELAQRVPVEIINCDVGQLYTPLSIGTAKPAVHEFPVPSYLFDRFDEPVDFSSSAYREEASRLVVEIWDRGHVPVFVGGSLFYVYALLFPPVKLTPRPESCALVSFDKLRASGLSDADLKNEVASSPPFHDSCPPDQMLAACHQELAAFSPEQLWEQLHCVDPTRALAIERSDRYRLERALCLWRVYGVLPSSCEPRFEPLAPFVLLFLKRERSELYSLINARVEEMVEQGFVDEVKQLTEEWRTFVRMKKLIGYSQMLDFVEEKISKAEAVSKTQQLTRNYAKRQGVFWRMLVRRLESEHTASQYGVWRELDLTLSPVTLYIEQVISDMRLFAHKENGNTGGPV